MRLRCFVILPYGPEYERVYEAVQSIRYLDPDTQIDFVRADRNPLTPVPESNITQHIAICDFAIAELSDMNPNVLFEIGYAAALHKPVVLLVDSEVHVPITLRDRQIIRYDRRELNTLTSELPAFLRGVLNAKRNPLPADTFVTRGYTSTLATGLSLNIRHARSRIDLFVLDLSHLLDADVLSEILRSREHSESPAIRILALDPESSIVNMYARQTGHRVAVFRQRLHYSIDHVIDAIEKVSERCELRLYDELPYFNLYRVDEVLFVSLLTFGSVTGSATTFRLNVNDPGAASEILETFERSWGNSSSVRG